MSNPMLNRLSEYERLSDESSSRMSVQGTLTSLFVLGILLLLPAIISWHWFSLGYIDKIQIANIIGIIAGFILGLIICFKPNAAPYLAPLYAVAEGTVLGSLSAMLEASFHNIVIQAVAATFITLFTMFALYKTKLIQVTEKLRSTIIIATLSVFILYLVSFITGLFGFTAIANLLWSNSIFGIVISVIITLVAAFNFLLDFDMIERYSQFEAPAYMNWYCAYGLLVTLVWLYLEFLRLLSKVYRK